MLRPRIRSFPKEHLGKIFLAYGLLSRALIGGILLKQAVYPKRRIKQIARTNAVHADIMRRKFKRKRLCQANSSEF